ncbi:hypothetical protein KCU62_g8385, partial [Aureobasidium sp. EXF-3399]
MKVNNFVWWLSWSSLVIASPLEERAASSFVCNNAQVKALRSSNANCYCSSYLQIPVSTVTKLTTLTSTIRTTTTKKQISTKLSNAQLRICNNNSDRNASSITSTINAQAETPRSSYRTGQESRFLDLRDADNVQEHEQSGYIKCLQMLVYSAFQTHYDQDRHNTYHPDFNKDYELYCSPRNDYQTESHCINDSHSSVALLQALYETKVSQSLHQSLPVVIDNVHLEQICHCINLIVHNKQSIDIQLEQAIHHTNLVVNDEQVHNLELNSKHSAVPAVNQKLIFDDLSTNTTTNTNGTTTDPPFFAANSTSMNISTFSPNNPFHLQSMCTSGLDISGLYAVLISTSGNPTLQFTSSASLASAFYLSTSGYLYVLPSTTTPWASYSDEKLIANIDKGVSEMDLFFGEEGEIADDGAERAERTLHILQHARKPVARAGNLVSPLYPSGK